MSIVKKRHNHEKLIVFYAFRMDDGGLMCVDSRLMYECPIMMKESYIYSIAYPLNVRYELCLN